MPKKISITFLFTIAFAIVVLFAATQVLADPPSIVQRGSLFTFVDIKGTPHKGYYRLDPSGTKILELKVDGRDIPPEDRKPLDAFSFCLEDKGGDVTIKGKKYSCHKPIVVTNEAGFVGNSGSCPWFINPPGIWIDPCKY